MADIRVRTLLIGAILVAGPLLVWVVVHFAVTTDTDRINSIIKDIATATNASDAAGMVKGIAPDFLDQRLRRADLEAIARAYFDRYGATEVWITGQKVSVQGSLATAALAVTAQCSQGEARGIRVRTRWQFSFEKRGKQWMVTGIRPISVEQYNLEGWDLILRNLGVTPSGVTGRP
jgi:hypothetical protein